MKRLNMVLCFIFVVLLCTGLLGCGIRSLSGMDVPNEQILSVSVTEKGYLIDYDFYSFRASTDEIIIEGIEQREVAFDDGRKFSLEVSGCDFPHKIECDNELYLPLKDCLKEYESSDVRFIDYTAMKYEFDAAAYGYCNTYSDSAGYLSGGGQKDIRKVVEGILYAYDVENEEYTELERIDKANIVAFNGTYCIYIKNNNYYSHKLGADEDLMLAGDHGGWFTAYSGVNENYFVLAFQKENIMDKNNYLEVMLFDSECRLLGEATLDSKYN